MAKTLKLQIVTPEATVYSEDVDMVTLPGVEGQIGILPNHVRLMTQMVPGEMIVRKDGQPVFLAVGGGLVEVSGDHVPILTDLAIAAKTSTKRMPKKHINGQRPDFGRRYLLKKLLPSMPP